jgi:hypothetical protein
MDVAARASRFALAAWDLYSAQAYADPVRAARGYPAAIFGLEWSRALVAALVCAFGILAAAFSYAVCVRPAIHMLGWAAWLALVIGVPAYCGFLAWSVPL